MTRISVLTPETAPEDAKPVLENVKRQIGMIPNLYGAFAHAPKALEAYLAFNKSLEGGLLSPRLREQIAVTTAGLNGCDYCASAHTALGKLAGVEEGELKKNLVGDSGDEKTRVALGFVRKVVKNRGHVEEDDLEALRKADFGEGEIVEIIAHTAINIFTNYFNHIAATDIDFPVVKTGEAANAA